MDLEKVILDQVEYFLKTFNVKRALILCSEEHNHINIIITNYVAIINGKQEIGEAIILRLEKRKTEIGSCIEVEKKMQEIEEKYKI